MSKNIMNTLFCINRELQNSNSDECKVMIDNRFILFTAEPFSCIEHQQLVSPGMYQVKVEGDLKFTSKQRWENFKVTTSLQENDVSFVVSNPKNESILQFNFTYVKNVNELPLNKYIIKAGNGNKLFDYKFAINENCIEEMTVKTSLCNFISKEEMKRLKAEQDKIRLINSLGKKEEVKTQLAQKASGGRFIKLYPLIK